MVPCCLILCRVILCRVILCRVIPCHVISGLVILCCGVSDGWVRAGAVLARVAWGAMLSVTEQIKAGSFDGLASAGPGKRLNDIFAGFAG